MSSTDSNDAQLVADSLAGQREAFARIVERYQSLICSLAYCATGSLGQSEDLAQETFVAAWKSLPELREPAKLRSWLCGIARNLIGKALRRDGREPIHRAEPLDSAEESAMSDPLPSDRAMTAEEQSLLWRALERLPETYREPLVLFYREHESVEAVAAKLELSEDAVKQRLSRGRKLLQEQMLAFVEGALRQTTPGRAFTVGVLVALPVFATSASAATVGSTAAKGAAAAKAAASFGLLGAILGPVVGLLGAWMGIKMSLANARSQREREAIVRMAKGILWVVGVFCVMVIAMTLVSREWWKTHTLAMAGSLIAVVAVYVATIGVLATRWNRILRQIRAEEEARLPGSAALTGLTKFCQRSLEFRSAASWLRLPWVHVRLNCAENGRIRPAKGWIAVGDAAYGGLFAFGSAWAVAPISIGGGFSLGLVTLAGGAAAGGLVVAGGAGLGMWALCGGLAVGWLAAGGCALGWLAAKGGVALAQGYAISGEAFAPQANNEAARSFYEQNFFLAHDAAFLIGAGVFALAALAAVCLMLFRLSGRSRSGS